MKPQHDAHYLAERLDEMLSSNQLPSDSHLLVQTAKRLQDAPSPQLSAEAYTRIRDIVLQTPVTPSTRWTSLGGIVIGAVVFSGILFAIIASSVVQTWGTANTSVAPAVESTLTITETPLQFDTTDPTGEIQPAAISTEGTSETADALLPTETQLSTPRPGNLILEGVVDTITIDDQVIMVYGIVIHIDGLVLPEQLGVGDYVHIEGYIDHVESEAIFIASSIVRVSQSAIDVSNNDDASSDDEESAGTSNLPSSDAVPDNFNPDTDTSEINCQNPPPANAPAVGWRTRCEGSDSPRNTNPGRGN